MSAPSTPTSSRARASYARADVRRERDGMTPDSTRTPRPPTYREIQHVATPLPDNRNLHYAHPTTILKRLLDDISNPESRHHARYGHFVINKGEELVDLLHRCVRKEVWHLVNKLSTQPSPLAFQPDIQELALLGGELKFYGRAIYLHIVTFAPNHANAAKISRLYVGQAFNLAARVKNQHSDWRYRRDHPSLHNFAMDRSSQDMYVVLAVIREACDRSDLVLNLLEMWMALWLGTLPDATKEAWLGTLPDGSDTGHVFGLNVAEPLDQGDNEAWKGAFNMLRNAKDEMAREYFWDVRKRPRPVMLPRKDAVLPNVMVDNTWLKFLPHALGILVLGFAVGRWSVVLGRRR